MTKEMKALIAGTIALFVVGIGSAVVFKGAPTDVTSEIEEIPMEDLNSPTITPTGDAGARAPSVPALDRFVVTDALPESEHVRILAEMKETASALKKNMLSRELWLELAALRTLSGDYQGAETIYRYMITVWPDHVAWSNLGSLYAGHMHMIEKAEDSFRNAIAASPKHVQNYLTFHDFYAATESRIEFADDVLFDGLAANPDDLFLLFSLARFYRDAGNKSDARAYFERLKEAAAAKGDTETAARAEMELTSL